MEILKSEAHALGDRGFIWGVHIHKLKIGFFTRYYVTDDIGIQKELDRIRRSRKVGA